MDLDDDEEWSREGRKGYIKNISKKLSKMNRLLLNAAEGAVDLDDHHDTLTRFGHLEASVRHQEKERVAQRRGNLKMSSASPREQRSAHPEAEDVRDRLPGIAQPKEKQLNSLVTLNLSGLRDQASIAARSLNELPNKAGPRSWSVLNLSQGASTGPHQTALPARQADRVDNYLSLPQKQNQVIKKLKNIDKHYFESFALQRERYSGITHVSARDRSADADTRVAPASRLSLQKSKTGAGPVVPAFPFNKIRILKQSEEDYQKEREELDTQMQIIADYQAEPAFGYRDGAKKLAENDVFFNSKLDQIDQVVQQYFRNNSDLSMQTQIVKIKDVSAYPAKPRARKRGAERDKVGDREPEEYEGPYARQLHSSRFLETLESRDLLNFINGKQELTDHQGFLLSKTGTKMNAVARAAISESQLRRLQREQQQQKSKLYARALGRGAAKGQPGAISETADSDDQVADEKFEDFQAKNAFELIHRYLMHRRRVRKKKQRAQKASQERQEASPSPSSPTSRAQDAEDSPLRVLLMINAQLLKENHMDIEQIEHLNRDLHGLDFIEEDDYVSDDGVQPRELTTKDFEAMPADLRHLVEQLRHFHKLKDQQVYSRSLMKLVSRYQRHLAKWLSQNGRPVEEGVGGKSLGKDGASENWRTAGYERRDSASAAPEQPYQDLARVGDDFFDSGSQFRQTSRANTGNDFAQAARTTNAFERQTTISEDMHATAVSGFGLSQMRATATSSGLNQTLGDFNAQVAQLEQARQQRHPPMGPKQPEDLMQRLLKATVQARRRRLMEQKKRDKSRGPDQEHVASPRGKQSLLVEGDSPSGQAKTKSRGKLQVAVAYDRKAAEKQEAMAAGKDMHLERKQRERYMAQAMVNNIREQDIFQKNFQKAVKLALHASGKERNEQDREKPMEMEKNAPTAVPEDGEGGSHPPSADEEEASEMLSSITKKMSKKTEEQRDAEITALQAFLLECERRKVYVKPVLKELKAKTLRMVNIKLDSGLQQALRKFIAEGAKGALALTSVAFAQNGLGDEELAELLAPLAADSASVHSIVSVSNGFGERSLAALERIVESARPEAVGRDLQELNLNGAKIAKKSVFAELLQMLSAKCTKIRRLGLSGHQLDDVGAEQLKNFVASARHLKTLDLSQLKLPKFSLFLDVLEAVAKESRALQYLNLGGNGLHEVGDPRPEFGALKNRFIEVVASHVSQSQTLVHLNLSGCFIGLQANTGPARTQNDGVASQERRPLQTEPTAATLNANLAQDSAETCQLTVLFTAIARSKSLQAVHYSGNSLNDRSMQKIKKILGVVDGHGYLTGGTQENDHLDRMFAGLSEQVDVQKINQMIQEQENHRIKMPERKFEGLRTNSRRDKNKRSGILKPARQNSRAGKLQNAQNFRIQQKEAEKTGLRSEFPPERDFDIPNRHLLSTDTCALEANILQDDRIIFSRFLGHREIHNGHKWCFRKECWICEGWKYTLFIWSQPLAEQSDLYQQRDVSWLQRWEEQLVAQNSLPSSEQVYDMNKRKDAAGEADQKRESIGEMRAREGQEVQQPQIEEDPHGCPAIVGPPTNFIYKKMVPLPRFSDLVALNRRPWLRIYEEKEEQERLKATRAAKNQKLTPAQIQASNREWPYTLNAYIKQHDKQAILNIPRFQKYRMDPTEQFYCYADFYPPQPKQILLAIQSQNSDKISLVGQKLGRRALPPPNSLKSVKKVRLSRRFDLQSSLFGSWKTDLPRHWEKCFRADMKYSKIYKFVREKSDFDALSKVLLEHYPLIFEQYLYGQAVSNYPTVGMIDFQNPAVAWGVVDKKDLSSTDIDRLFVAVNFEEVAGEQGDLEDNPDRELCRYEFFEILVRIAKLKYENQKLGLSISAAVAKLLEDYVYQHQLRQEWHGLRKRELWTLEVHDMLEANVNSLKLFVSWWLKNRASKRGKKALQLEDLLEMANSIPKATTGKGPASQTVRKELSVKDQQIVLCFANSKFPITDEMTHADLLGSCKFDEFLEFLARVADLADLGGEQDEGAEGDAEDGEQEEAGDEAEGGGGQQMLLQDKLFHVIDLFLRLMRDGRNLRATRPNVAGLGDSESDYED